MCVCVCARTDQLATLDSKRSFSSQKCRGNSTLLFPSLRASFLWLWPVEYGPLQEDLGRESVLYQTSEMSSCKVSLLPLSHTPSSQPDSLFLSSQLECHVLPSPRQWIRKQRDLLFLPHISLHISLHISCPIRTGIRSIAIHSKSQVQDRWKEQLVVRSILYFAMGTELLRRHQILENSLYLYHHRLRNNSLQFQRTLVQVMWKPGREKNRV